MPRRRNPAFQGGLGFLRAVARYASCVGRAQPASMRPSFDGLYALVRHVMQQDVGADVKLTQAADFN